MGIKGRSRDEKRSEMLRCVCFGLTHVITVLGTVFVVWGYILNVGTGYFREKQPPAKGRDWLFPPHFLACMRRSLIDCFNSLRCYGRFEGFLVIIRARYPSIGPLCYGLLHLNSSIHTSNREPQHKKIVPDIARHRDSFSR
jgi:hypothetical protein